MQSGSDVDIFQIRRRDIEQLVDCDSLKRTREVNRRLDE